MATIMMLYYFLPKLAVTICVATMLPNLAISVMLPYLAALNNLEASKNGNNYDALLLFAKIGSYNLCSHYAAKLGNFCDVSKSGNITCA